MTTDLQRLHLLALRLQREWTGLGLAPTWSEGAPSPSARLEALLGSTETLTGRVLPELRRAVRCEAARASERQRQPAGGRLDIGASLRQAGGAMPREWVVHRVARVADTPVNRLLAAILGRARETFTAIRGSFPAESALVGKARSALDRFLRGHPLGTLPAGGDPARHLRVARRRPAELRRFSTTLDWWRTFEAQDLTALEDAAGELKVQRGYALVIELVVRLAAQERAVPIRAGASPFDGAPPSLLVADGPRVLEAWADHLPQHSWRLRAYAGQLAAPAVLVAPHTHPAADVVDLDALWRDPRGCGHRLLHRLMGEEP
jgi:hypothetical protein